MGDKWGFYIVRYRPKKVIGVKNMVFWFFAYIDSIDPLLSKYAFNPAETVIKVVKRQEYCHISDAKIAEKRLKSLRYFSFKQRVRSAL